MTTTTIESLNIPLTYVAQYRAEIAAEYRLERGHGRRPTVAAGNVMRFRASVVAHGWAERGEVQPVSGLAYLIAREWYEAAQRLDCRRAFKMAPA